MFPQEINILPQLAHISIGINGQMFGLNERANINIKADGWWEAGTVQTIYTGTELFQWVSIYNPKILIT